MNTITDGCGLCVDITQQGVPIHTYADISSTVDPFKIKKTVLCKCVIGDKINKTYDIHTVPTDTVQ